MPSIQTPDGIGWYIQQSGSGPDVVLIPSGEGDCTAFDSVISLLSASFKVTTFDTPGMSRTSAPAEAIKDVTGEKLATQIMGLMDALDIKVATFYGCSSGGAATLCLQKLFPDRVRNALVHEVPTPDTLPHLPNLEDPTGAIDPSDPMDGFVRHLVGERKDWLALPAAYRERVPQNLPIWQAGYFPALSDSTGEFIKDDANFKHRPIDWTLGSLSPMGMFLENARIALRLGIPLSLLPSLHFPQITCPKELAEHIETATKKYL